MAGFDRVKVANLLAKCHRRCCICHRFCGFKMETDHIKPISKDGKDDINNALPVCFECHAEIHCYNTAHPRGRKFTEQELIQHKKQWLNICEKNPEILAQPFHDSGVGPLNSLVDELEYNLKACECLGSLLSVSQFEEALRKGAISLLESCLKDKIYTAYSEINHLNQLFYAFANQDLQDAKKGYKRTQVNKAMPKTKEATENAYNKLLEFLQKDTDN